MGSFEPWGVDTSDSCLDLLYDNELCDYLGSDLPFNYADFASFDSCRTIHDDIKLIESSGSVTPSDESVTSEIELDIKPKIEIRNIDCMWSGYGNSNIIGNNITHCNSNMCSDKKNQKTNQQQRQKINVQQQQKNNHNCTNNTNSRNNCCGNDVNENQKSDKKFSEKNIQNIPPGASLLINSRLNSQKNKSLNKSNNNASSIIPNVSDFLKERETSISNTTNSIYTARPDTPLSLDDDAPEFKQVVDLAACITGSNNMSLNMNTQDITTVNDKLIIKKLKEQLEDPSTDNIDIRKIIPGGNKRSLSEVLHAIGNVENENYFGKNNCSSNDSITIQQLINQQKQQMIYTDGINTAPDSEVSQSSSESEGEDEDDIEDDDEHEISSSSCGVTHSNSNIFRTPSSTQYRKSNNYTTYIDHSYTRSNESTVDVVGIGLETPSDSDEEIDVVSVGDKKLPTNPSDKDRRALQHKVANKISERIVKTPNGIRTIPPRKRNGGTFDPPYTIIPLSNISSPIKSISVGNPRYGSFPTNTSSNYSSVKSQNYSNNNNTNNNNSVSAGRKRNSIQNNNIENNNCGIISNKQQQQNDEYIPPSKRSRNNCNQTTSSNNNGGNNNTNTKNTSKKSTNGRRHNDAEEQDTIEKRNLHNDMERQRRIGLKNLFEELKKQIPNIKDKERAPKVHILREAAKLCEQLMHDEKTLTSQKNQLLIQIHRKQEFLDAKLN